jgi:P27 family predicted phage terminase small subunit
MPRPISDSTKRLKGTYKPTRATGELLTAAPVDAKRLRCPASLKRSPVARQLWRSLSRELVELGTLAGCDLPLLERACVAFARHVEAEGILDAEGAVTTSDRGVTREHPAAGASRRWLAIFERLATRLGMGVASRSAVRVVPPADEQDDAAWSRLVGNTPLGPRRVG